MNQEGIGLGKFSVRFIEFMLFWNHCELSARQILQLLLGEGETAMAVAAEIKNQPLCDALRAAGRDKKFSHIRQHIDHFVTGYRVMVDYRNYYVHGIFGVKAGVGGLLSLSGKGGRLKYHQDTLTIEKLAEMSSHLHMLMAYGAALQKELGAQGDGIESLVSTYSGSLEKPKWPPELKKLPRYIQEP
ncbi:hypothetical protein [Rhizorhapis sp. SPR117]|uniref:hypothetical protein n=1 Tax=Rhizorhapis sp. SPR117 TaxID=2912611 RepID=UPI001F210F36|nr:hypothetical protein [Rhizorhapis sp. SPR117]